MRLLGFAAFLVVLCLAIAPLASDKSTNTTDADKRFERIINGLLPAAALKGQPVPRMTLAERMKYYNTPEVSIAFFRDGRVDWARGYGLADKTTNKPLRLTLCFKPLRSANPLLRLQRCASSSRES